MRQRDAGNRDAERARIAAKGNRYFIQPTFNVRFWHFSDIAGCPTCARGSERRIESGSMTSSSAWHREASQEQAERWDCPAPSINQPAMCHERETQSLMKARRLSGGTFCWRA
jgi:hypothetical protein